MSQEPPCTEGHRAGPERGWMCGFGLVSASSSSCRPSRGRPSVRPVVLRDCLACRTRRDVRNVWRLRYLAALSVNDRDACAIEKAAGRLFQLHYRLFVCNLGGDQRRFGQRQCGLILQYRNRSRRVNIELPLFCIERLSREIDGCLSGFDAGAVLLDAELSVPHLDANLI